MSNDDTRIMPALAGPTAVDPLSLVAKTIIDGHFAGVADAVLARQAREQLLAIWPDGVKCQHAAARQCFAILEELERRGRPAPPHGISKGDA